MGDLVRRQYVVSGRVQGVYYRVRVRESARRHGLVGRVRNRADGTVLIEVQGPIPLMEAFLKAVSGPHGLSDARRIERIAELPVRAELIGFYIDRDGGETA